MSRDKRIVNLAIPHSVEGYKEGPFSQSKVTAFLKKMATVKEEVDEKTREEIVRECVLFLPAASCK